MKYFHLVWANLRRKKMRTLLTFLSILVAFLLFGYLSAIKTAFSAGVDVAGADRLIVRHKVSIIQTLPASYKARILNISGVARAAHSSWFGGVYQDPMNFFPQMAVEPEDYLALYPEFKLPEDQKQAWLMTRTGAVVGRKTAEKYKWKIGDRIPLEATVWVKKDGSRVWEFDIVGIYDADGKSADTTQFLFRYDYFDEARAFAKGEVGWYIARVDNPDHAVEAAKKIDEEFSNSPFETKAETEGAFVQAFAKQIGDIGSIMIAILSAVFFTILLVAGNTMSQSVRERVEELGLLKALGFTNEQVLLMVLAESTLLAGFGGFVGLGLAVALISMGDPTGGALPLFYFPLRDQAAGVGLVFALGLAAGFFPALKAMRLNVSEAMRRM